MFSTNVSTKAYWNSQDKDKVGLDSKYQARALLYFHPNKR
jgi:hypothetical protein